VHRVKRRSNAASAGIRPGDRILAVNGHETPRVRDVKRATTGRKRRWELIIRRGNQNRRLIFE
jgi:C-terminal processing protease CtpA/Prc